MNALVGLSRLRKGRDKRRSRLQVFPPNLAVVTMLNVAGDVSVHARPVVALQETFLCLVDPIMA